MGAIPKNLAKALALDSNYYMPASAAMRMGCQPKHTAAIPITLIVIGILSTALLTVSLLVHYNAIQVNLFKPHTFYLMIGSGIGVGLALFLTSGSCYLARYQKADLPKPQQLPESDQVLPGKGLDDLPPNPFSGFPPSED